MPFPQITVKKYKDGRLVAKFRDNQGLVRTDPGITNASQWVRAEDIRTLANYGISLQVAQARAGLGSDGNPMPPLKGSKGHSIFVARVNGRATFTRKTYADWKAAHGLQPIRDLYGPGKDGHMLDDIRINYLDNQKATISISRRSSQIKARANETRAPWWGWSPDSYQKLVALAGELFPQSVADRIYDMGIIGAQALASAKGARFFRRIA